MLTLPPACCRSRLRRVSFSITHTRNYRNTCSRLLTGMPQLLPMVVGDFVQSFLHQHLWVAATCGWRMATLCSKPLLINTCCAHSERLAFTAAELLLQTHFTLLAPMYTVQCGGQHTGWYSGNRSLPKLLHHTYDRSWGVCVCVCMCVCVCARGCVWGR